MDIIVYKSKEEFFIRDYCLTNCSIEELENNILGQCIIADVEFPRSAVSIKGVPGYKGEQVFGIKGLYTEMTIRQVAIKIHEFYWKGKARETMLSKDNYIALCIGSDTMVLKKEKAELHSLFEAWNSGNKPESRYAPGELMTYEDFQLRVFLLADQIHHREKALSEAPEGYESEWESYLECNTKKEGGRE